VVWPKHNTKCHLLILRTSQIVLAANHLIREAAVPIYMEQLQISINRETSVVDLLYRWKPCKTLSGIRCRSLNKYINRRYSHCLQNLNQNNQMLMLQVPYPMQGDSKSLVQVLISNSKGQVMSFLQQIESSVEVCMKTHKKKTNSDVGEEL
jgi:hypothetical protein